MKTHPRNLTWRTLNQLVAFNTRRLRRARGWTQEDLATHLSAFSDDPWTGDTVSKLESGSSPWAMPKPGEGSAPKPLGRKPRRITIDELGILAYVLGTTVFDLLLPESNEHGIRLGPSAYFLSYEAVVLNLFHLPAQYALPAGQERSEPHRRKALEIGRRLKDALQAGEDLDAILTDEERKILEEWMGPNWFEEYVEWNTPPFVTGVARIQKQAEDRPEES
jgi:transcriptional regulator with XRE-family HTH domain